MALSQADFYAYSRATGAPVPRDPEEQAQMTPEVLEFRRNQLKAPSQPTQQGINVPQALGIGAAALGLGAAGYGISRLLGRKPALAAKESVVRPATTDLNRAKNALYPDAVVREHLRQVAEARIPPVPQQPVRSSSLPEVKPSTPPPSPAKGFSPRRYAESTGALEAKPDLTSVQDSLEVNNQDQFINAVESGEDQQTGRVKNQLQRNPGLDLGNVDALEDSFSATPYESSYTALRLTGVPADEAINRVASSLPDGLPLDQAENVPTRTLGSVGSLYQNVIRTPGQSGVQLIPTPGSSEVSARIEGRPFRFTQLTPGTTTEGDYELPSMLSAGRSKYAQYGLSAPETHILPTEVKENVQRFLQERAQEVLPTHQKQALNIYQTTGDPAFLEAAFSDTPSLPAQVKLPGGEVIATRNLYQPFAQTINPKTGVPVVETREQNLLRLQGPEGIRSRIRERTMEVIEGMEGERPVFPSPTQLSNLPRSQKRALVLGQRDVANAEAALERAKDFGVLYSLKPEVQRGTYSGPEFQTNPLTGKQTFIGMVPKVEQEALTVPRYYQSRASQGSGRQDLGSVGRRREQLAGEGMIVAEGSPLDATPYLFKNVDTGDILMEGEVKREDLLSGAVQPVRGTAIEPQRIMGSEGRTFKGVSTLEVDPRSFDPAALQELKESYPERIDPSSGLIYSTSMLGGAKRAAKLAEQAQLQREGKYKESIRLGKELATPPKMAAPGSQEGIRFTSLSDQDLNETILQARAAGMPDVQQSAQNVLDARDLQRQKVSSVDVSAKLRQLQLRGRPGEAEAFLQSFKQGII